MTDQTPGVDWQAKQDTASSNANQTQHPSYTIADGTSVTQHQHPKGEEWVNNLMESK